MKEDRLASFPLGTSLVCTKHTYISGHRNLPTTELFTIGKVYKVVMLNGYHTIQDDKGDHRILSDKFWGDSFEPLQLKYHEFKPPPSEKTESLNINNIKLRLYNVNPEIFKRFLERN